MVLGLHQQVCTDGLDVLPTVTTTQSSIKSNLTQKQAPRLHCNAHRTEGGTGEGPAQIRPLGGIPSQPRNPLGAFSHSAGTARAQRGHSANYYGDYPGNNPENHPPCGIMHNQFKTQKFKHLMLAMGPRDLNSVPYSPVHCSSHSMTSV